VLRAKQLKTLNLCKQFKCKIKNLKTYSDGCPNQGLSNHTTFWQFWACDTVPLILVLCLFLLFCSVYRYFSFYCLTYSPLFFREPEQQRRFCSHYTHKEDNLGGGGRVYYTVQYMYVGKCIHHFPDNCFSSSLWSKNSLYRFNRQAFTARNNSKF